MQKWEYLTEAVAVSPMAARGQDGWRLVAIDSGVMFYERPVEPEPEPPVAWHEMQAPEPMPEPVPPQLDPATNPPDWQPPPEAAPPEPEPAVAGEPLPEGMPTEPVPEPA